ncbi:MAG: thioesterase family protein [Cellvibrionales bacterium]|nr:thioesterase family protein [Cellvibrionales bacterium]
MTDTDESSFRAMPWDIDMFCEMNNGRVITLYDLGRFSLASRTGLGDVLRKNRWGLVVAGSTVQYRKRIHMFDKVQMKTRLLDVQGRWMYIAQSMWVNNTCCSSIVLRTAVTEKGKAIDTQRVLDAMGIEHLALQTDEAWVRQWVAVDNQRQYPD